MQEGWTSLMKVNIIFVFVCVWLLGCSERSIKNLPKESYAPEPIYPDKLKYNPQDNRYLGDQGLELRSDRLSIDLIEANLPISTFESAFNFAYHTLGEYYTYDLINSQLPLLIDYREGIWIVNGSLSISESKNVSVLRGAAEMAFLEETGEILYIVHTL